MITILASWSSSLPPFSIASTSVLLESQVWLHLRQSRLCSDHQRLLHHRQQPLLQATWRLGSQDNIRTFQGHQQQFRVHHCPPSSPQTCQCIQVTTQRMFVDKDCDLLIARDKIVKNPASFAGTRLRQSLGLGPGDTVTWSQFIGHIVASPVTSYDSHWYPVSDQCGLCSVQYDLILDMETLSQQWPQLALMTGLHLPPLPRMNHRDKGVFKFSFQQNSWFSG